MSQKSPTDKGQCAMVSGCSNMPDLQPRDTNGGLTPQPPSVYGNAGYLYLRNTGGITTQPYCSVRIFSFFSTVVSIHSDEGKICTAVDDSAEILTRELFGSELVGKEVLS